MIDNKIETINFNVPADGKALEDMFKKNEYPAFFMFEPSTALLVKYGNHYVRSAEKADISFWYLLPKTPFTPKHAIQQGYTTHTNIVSTEVPKVPSVTNDITLIYKDNKPEPINLLAFQQRVQQEIFNNQNERQR